MSSLNNYVLNPKTGRAVSATRSKELQEKGLTPRKLSSIEWIINPETGKPNKKKQGPRLNAGLNDQTIGRQKTMR